MNTVPIVFAFDNNLILPACVCISSLMMNAKDDTFYDIFILHSVQGGLRKDKLNLLPQYYSNCRIQYREVDNTFDHAFEIRGITTPAYYRLLIPKLIPEYGKIIYSDVDVIFRDDLCDLYQGIDMGWDYVAGVNSLSHLNETLKKYYHALNVNPSEIIYSGNLIINSKALLDDDVIRRFMLHAKKRYTFQDMDIINIICSGKIKFLPPSFCVTTYFTELAVNHDEDLLSIWPKCEIQEAFKKGIIHYNGQKPWKGYCINFDIWWEYYRKSPYFDEKFYYDFFAKKVDEYDRLPLSKRIKILVRFFIHGKRE